MMAIVSKHDLLVGLIFTPLTMVVLIIVLVWGAVQIYKCASSRTPVERVEERIIPRLTEDSRRHSPYLTSEFMEASRTTSSVRTVQLTDEISIVGDAAFAGTSIPCPLASGSGVSHQKINLASSSPAGAEESNTRFAVDFYTQTQNEFFESKQAGGSSFYERPRSEIFKLACCFGCCFCRRRAGHLGDSNEPKLVNFELHPKDFAEHTMPKQFLCEKPSISLTDLVRVQRSEYRTFVQSTLRNSKKNLCKSFQNRMYTHSVDDIPAAIKSVGPPTGTTMSIADPYNIVDFSNATDTIINIPDDSNSSNDVKLENGDQIDENRANMCELSVLHEAISSTNSCDQSSGLIHAKRTPDSTNVAVNSRSVVNSSDDGRLTPIKSVASDENLINNSLENFHNSSSSGVSIDTSDTPFSSGESLMTTCVKGSTDSTNHLPISVSRSIDEPCPLNLHLKASSMLSMRPTNLDEAVETPAISNEDVQPGFSNEELNNYQALDERVSNCSRQAQQLPDSQPLQAKLEHEYLSCQDSMAAQENQDVLAMSVDFSFEEDTWVEEKDSEMGTNSSVESFHHFSIVGNKFDGFWV